MANNAQNPSDLSIATLGGGCFWCVEAVFQDLKGVHKVVSGYSGGHVANPTYEEVCGKKTGHAEVVQVFFDPKVIEYKTLVEIFFATHDPTTPNRQGNDVGPQYRSVIYTHDEAQQKVAEEVKVAVDAEGIYPNPIVTEIEPLTTYYDAEAYHQNYFKQHSSQPYCAFVISPKVGKFRQRYTHLLKTGA